MQWFDSSRPYPGSAERPKRARLRLYQRQYHHGKFCCHGKRKTHAALRDMSQLAYLYPIVCMIKCHCACVVFLRFSRAVIVETWKGADRLWFCALVRSCRCSRSRTRSATAPRWRRATSPHKAACRTPSATSGAWCSRRTPGWLWWPPKRWREGRWVCT